MGMFQWVCDQIKEKLKQQDVDHKTVYRIIELLKGDEGEWGTLKMDIIDAKNPTEAPICLSINYELDSTGSISNNFILAIKAIDEQKKFRTTKYRLMKTKLEMMIGTNTYH